MIMTSDLWNCAFLVSKGIEIESIEINQTANNKKYAVYFIFIDPKAEELNKQFLNGKATGNITQIKLCMNHLKDIMHDKLRESKVLKMIKITKDLIDRLSENLVFCNRI